MVETSVLPNIVTEIRVTLTHHENCTVDESLFRLHLAHTFLYTSADPVSLVSYKLATGHAFGI